jgi:ABC-type multidrug transport system ATPase subunit
MRELDESLTLRRALAPEGDSVIHQGRTVHVASWAARFLFTSEQLNQPVRNLSGGERARVLIAKLMLEPADVLLLDEPTNDLDIPTLEILEENLLDFPGALVLVTHDRYLLNRVASTVLGLDGRGHTGQFADYAQWEDWLEEQDDAQDKQIARAPMAQAKASKPAPTPLATNANSAKKKLSYLEAREFAAIEHKVEVSDARLAAARDHVEHPDVATNSTALQEALKELDAAQHENDALYARWAELTEKAPTPPRKPAPCCLPRLHLSGQYTLTGQHNFPNDGSRWTDRVYDLTAKYPGLFGEDFGFSAGEDKDSVESRPAMIAEVKRQYEHGAVIALTWHAVKPTEDEPVTFRDSVQGHLTDFEWRELLTPGTALNQPLVQAQVDVIAGYLRQLRDAHVPVLFRAYHEMNGNWFWWDGRPGPDGSAALYRQIYDRFVNVHHLDNLLWVWNVNAPGGNAGSIADYYPGPAYADILTMDIYGEFKQDYYTEMLKLAAGKPIALGEVGAVPTPEILAAQPRYAYFMAWSEFIPESKLARPGQRHLPRPAHA